MSARSQGGYSTKDENNRANRRRTTRKRRSKIRQYEIWETKIRSHKRAIETMNEMGWGEKKPKGRGEKRRKKARKTNKKGHIPKKASREY